MTEPEQTCSEENEAVRHLKAEIAAGKGWFIALLEAISLWTAGEESCDGRLYRYVIDGEAFDWLLLAERLLDAVNDLVPDEERRRLLFHGRPPVKLRREDFRRLIGPARYRQYLNYFYGVTVEEALIQAVFADVRKEKRLAGSLGEAGIMGEVFTRLYGATRTELLKRFRRLKGYPLRRATGLGELKEFTYWLFKYRLEHADPARVASDVKRALDMLTADGYPFMT